MLLLYVLVGMPIISMICIISLYYVTKKPTILHDNEDDEIMQMVVSRAFETGNIVTANRMDDGSIQVTESPISQSDQYHASV